MPQIGRSLSKEKEAIHLIIIVAISGGFLLVEHLIGRSVESFVDLIIPLLLLILSFPMSMPHL